MTFTYPDTILNSELEIKLEFICFAGFVRYFILLLFDCF